MWQDSLVLHVIAKSISSVVWWNVQYGCGTYSIDIVAGSTCPLFRGSNTLGAVNEGRMVNDQCVGYCECAYMVMVNVSLWWYLDS